MALTRAQLLSGSQGQGTVLAGQVQGVKKGAGIAIATDGTISVDATTVTGLMKLNSLTAYNAYVWPNTAGSVGQFLWTDGLGNLDWKTPQGFAVVTVSPIQPAPPDEGELWYDCQTGTLKVYQSCTAPAGWTNVAQPGLQVLPANTSAAPPFTNAGSPTGGTVADPWLCSAATATPGATVLVVNTVTVSNLAPFQYVPIVDLNAVANSGRFTFTNNYADASGNLIFQTIFNDSPSSVSGTNFTANIKIGYGTAYVQATISVVQALALVSPGTIAGTPTVGSVIAYTPGTTSGGTPPVVSSWIWKKLSDSSTLQTGGTSYTIPASLVGDKVFVAFSATDATPTTVSGNTANLPATGTIAFATISTSSWNPSPSTGLDSIPGLLSGPYNGTGTTITPTGCIEASVNGLPYSSSAQPITSGQSLAVRWKSTPSCGDANSNTPLTGTVSDGIGLNTYNITVNRVPTPVIANISDSNIALGATTTKAIAAPIAGINATAYVNLGTGSTGTGIQVSTDNVTFVTPVAAPSTLIPIVNGQTLYIRQTVGATASTGYTAIVLVGDADGVLSDSVTYTATTVNSNVFPITVFTPSSGPTASPQNTSLSVPSLFGVATSTWADGSTSLTSTGDLEFSVNGAPYTQASTAVVDTDTVDLRWNAAAADGAANAASLTGDLTNAINTNSYTLVVDKLPTAYAWTDLTSQAVSTAVTSSVLTVAGINCPAELTYVPDATNPLTTVQASIDGGAYVNIPTTTPGLVINPANAAGTAATTIQIKGTTGAGTGVAYKITTKIGKGAAVVSDEWSVTTTAVTASITTPSITSPANGTLNLNPATNTPAGIPLVGNTYAPLNGAGAVQTSSTWEVYKGAYPVTSTGTVTAISSVTVTATATGPNGGAGGNATGYTSLTYGLGKFVSAGSSKQATSTDAITWTLVSTLALEAVIFDGTKFIAGGTGIRTSSTVPTSNASWTSVNATTGVTALAYDPTAGLYLAGTSTGAILSSTDGTTWTSRTSNISTRINSFAYGGGRWTAVGVTGGTTSTDNGLTWTAAAAASGSSIAYGGGVWVKTDVAGTSTQRSTNGTTWSTVTITGSAFSVLYTQGIFVIGQVDSLGYSTNGGTSFAALGSTSGTKDLLSVAYGNNIIAGYNNGASGNYIRTTSLTITNSLTITGASGDGFLVGMPIIGNTSGATATISAVSGTSISVTPTTGTFVVGETVSTVATQITGSPFTVSASPFTTVSIPQAALAVSSTYYARVKYATTNPTAATSSYSVWSSFGTAASFVLAPGTAYGGGYFAGQIRVFAGQDGGGLPAVDTIYNLIVAPLAGGQYGGATGAIIKYKPAGGGDSPQAVFQNKVYGKPANDAGNDSAHPIFQWARSVTVGGFTDWYVPAKNELEILYYNLKPKPTTGANQQPNNTSSGANANAVPARASNYTAVGPPNMTTASDFQWFGGEPFGFSGEVYWSSTEVSTDPLSAWSQSFGSGQQIENVKPQNLLGCRVVRRVAA